MKNKKVIFTIAGICMAVGLVISVFAWLLGGRPGFYLNASGIHASYEKSDNKVDKIEKTALEDFSSFNIKVSFADINIIPSDGYYLEYCISSESGNPAHSVDKGVFTFDEQTKDSFGFGNLNFFTINTSWNNYYINLYVPEDKYFEVVKLENNSGNVKFDTFKAKSLDMDLSYGNLTMEAFEGDDFTVDMSSGRFKVDQLKAVNINITDEYGDVSSKTMEASNAKIKLSSGGLKIGSGIIDTLDITNSYGAVTFESLTNSSGRMVLNSGNLKIASADLKKLDVTDDYGSVTIVLAGNIDDYGYDVKTSYGNIRIPGFHKDDDSSDQRYILENNKDKMITINCSSGDIKISDD